MSAELFTALSKFVTETVQAQVTKELEKFDVHEAVQDQAKQELAKFNVHETVHLQAKATVHDILTKLDIPVTLNGFVSETIKDQVKQELAKFNVQETVQYQAKATVHNILTKLDIPDKGIKNSSIDWEGFSFSSDMVKGRFNGLSSNGLTDSAESVQLTIDDRGVVVHHNLIVETISAATSQAENITVTNNADFNNATFTGDVSILGNLTADSLVGLQSQLDNKQSYTINGKTVLSEDSIGPSILNSNLRRIGTLKELQVEGEALIGDTLYVSPTSRVGINTDEPTHALTLWDQEICLTFGKYSKGVAVIGTERNQDIMLKSGTNDNVILKADGTTEIEKPVLNGKKFTSGNKIPGYPGQVGDICWNTTPLIGQPIGWVCIQGLQWCNFGTIT